MELTSPPAIHSRFLRNHCEKFSLTRKDCLVVASFSNLHMIMSVMNNRLVMKVLNLLSQY